MSGHTPWAQLRPDVPPERAAEFRVEAEVAQLVYDLRTERGLSQAELAEAADTSPEVVEAIEEMDDQYGVNRLARIAFVFDCRLVISFEPIE